jgi:threonine/homoserine/homoserine lactone efflux protein
MFRRSHIYLWSSLELHFCSRPVDADLLFRAALACAVVVLTPGPAVLALLNLAAVRGRRAGAGFIFGHLAGDLLWTVLALVALVWLNVLSPVVFIILGFFCGGYLAYLGVKALFSKASSGKDIFNVKRPVFLGLTFGLSNPKSYPVTLSLFTALLGSRLNDLTLVHLPLFLLVCFAGFLVADFILIWLIGLSIVRNFYKSYSLWITRATGLLFLYFAGSVLWHTLRR